MQIADAAALGLIGAVTTALVGAVKTLYSRLSQLYDRMSEASDQCEKDRGDLAEKIERLEGRMDACSVADCPLRPLRSMPSRTITTNNKTDPGH